MSKGIFLWRIARNKSTEVLMRIPIKDFKKLHRIAKKTKCRVEITSKKGLPFLVHKYKKRKIFAITLLVIAILIFGLTKFVWNIEINCDEEINNEEILGILSGAGIEEGKLISKLDTNKAINDICMKKEDISWVRNKSRWDLCLCKY